MLLLLSPAKTFDLDFESTIDQITKPRLVNHSTQLIQILQGYSPEKIQSLMKVSEKIADLNVGRYQNWNSKGNHHALWAFAGDVYRGLGAQDFTEEEVLFAQDHIAVLSGLYGLIRPLDQIDAYRLEMGTKLENPRGKNLYEFWGRLVTDLISNLEDQVVINLASVEYSKVVHFDQLDIPTIDIVFQEQKNGIRKIIAIHAKKARGLMTRYVVKNKITEPEDLKNFDLADYQFDTQNSTEGEFIFVR